VFVDKGELKMKTQDKRKRELIESMQGLIVSCQVQHDDPIYTKDMASIMAKAALWGGAKAIRANSPEQIKSIKEVVDLPIIGLWKIWHDDSEVFITPTIEACKSIWEAGAEVIALDCTFQTTHQKTIAAELIKQVKKEIPEAIIFADISTYEEAKTAIENGADIVAPTLYGYTEDTKNIQEPNMREFARMCRDFKDEAYVMMEGHIYSPEDAMKCLYLGAHSVVVGSAITRPHLTTKRFNDLIEGYTDNWRDAERSKH
jgi:N-acylglucosamine-6-phosphate 2-epimerase